MFDIIQMVSLWWRAALQVDYRLWVGGVEMAKYGTRVTWIPLAAFTNNGLTLILAWIDNHISL